MQHAAMKAAVYSGVNTVETVLCEVPVPHEGETLIRVEAAGICGTDMAIFAGKHPRAKAPLIMGHEIGGVVERIVGEAPKGVKTGSRVTFFPLISCGECFTCKTGKTYVCENLRLIGIDRDGGMAEYMVVPTDSVVPVPGHWPRNRAALMEPVAVAVHAVRRSSLSIGDTVLALGAGIIGNLCAQTAKAAGARLVAIADMVPSRLKLAAEAGLVTINLAEEDFNARVRELTEGVGFDVTMECSGSAGAQPLATAATRVLGEILVVGMPKEPPPVDLRMVTFKELTLVGTRVYEKIDFVRAADLVEEGKIAVDNLATHEFPVDRVKEAFDVMARAGDSLKVLITF